MSRPAVMIHPLATVTEAAHRMHRAGVRRLPVVDVVGRLVGIVRRVDLLTWFLRSDEELGREILEWEDRQDPRAGRPITVLTWQPFPCSGRLPQSQWAIRPYRPHCGRSILDRAGVARGMGKELSEMPEITLEDYKRVDRQLEHKRARRRFTIHAIVYAVALTGLIILSVTLGDVFPWAALPMACWGVGLTLHYLYGVRRVDKTISGRQAQIEQRAAAGKRAA